MPFEFKLPDIGEGIAEGEIVKWLVKEGDTVTEDQPLVQVETDKAVVDLPAPRAGTILELKYANGDTVPVGATLVVIGLKGEKSTPKVTSVKPSKHTSAQPTPQPPQQSNNQPKGQSVVGQLPEAPDETIEQKPQVQIMHGAVQSQKVKVAPALRKLASELNLDLTTLTGTGEGGRITAADLAPHINTAQKPAPVPQQIVPVTRSYSDQGYTERVPLKGIRKTMAENMKTSAQTVAAVTIMGDAVIQPLFDLKEREKPALAQKGIKLTLLPFIVKALTTALKEHPLLNASLEGNEVIIKKFYNIGIAVETEVGLLVPVLKEVDHEGIASIALEIAELADKARKRTITIEELQNATFTITNYGSYGGKYATPIINPPQAAILGIGAAFDHVQVDEKNQVTLKKVLPLSLTFDHRIIDGAQAAAFLKTLITYLTDPTHLLLEIN